MGNTENEKLPKIIYGVVKNIIKATAKEDNRYELKEGTDFGIVSVTFAAGGK